MDKVRQTRAKAVSTITGLAPEEILARWAQGDSYCQKHGWHPKGNCKPCMSERNKRHYQAALAEGICGRCKGAPARPGKNTCGECR